MFPRHLLHSFILVACILSRATAALELPSPPPGLREVLTLEDGTRIQIQEFPGVSKWFLLNHLFTDATALVRCPGHKDFAVYSGSSVEDVRLAYGNNEKAWCGWERFMGRSPEVCVVPVPVFKSTFVAVAKPKSWLTNIGGGSGNASCTMQLHQELSTPRLLAAVMGAFFFISAPQLSVSTPFRLAGGSLGFTALSALVILVLIYRSMPHRRSFVFTSVFFGSTVAAVMRYVFGTWIPSLSQLFKNPLVIGYTGLSGLMGLALAYYYNDTSNRKINTILKVALQLAGLGLLGGSATSREGAVMLVSSVLFSQLVPLLKQERNVMGALRRAKHSLEHDLEEEIIPAMTERGQQVVTAGMVSPSTPTIGQQAGASALAAAAAAGAVAGAAAAQAPSPLVDRGLILNVETGKTITIGKSTYNRLRDRGYEADFVAGTITPPSATGGKSDGGSGTPRGRGGSSGRARSRSRQRRS